MGWRGSMNVRMDDSADAGPSGALIGSTRADYVLRLALSQQIKTDSV
jgi:hypothetical protein